MDIKHIERVNVLSKKVLNSEATLQELAEYKALLKRWNDKLDNEQLLDQRMSDELLDY